MFLRGKVYWTKFRDKKGKQKAISLETKNKKLAKQREAKITVEIASGRFSESFDGDRMTIRELLVLFVRRTAKRTDSSVRQEKYISKRVNDRLGDLLLPKLTTLIVDEYIHNRREDGLKESSIGHELRMLKSAYTLAHNQWELIKSNPFSKCGKLPSAKTQRCRYLLPGESLRLLEEICRPGNEWLRDVVIFARETGLRISNIMELQWKQIDFERKMLTIEGHYTKTGKPLFIPMSPNVFHIISGIRADERHDTIVFARWNMHKEEWTSSYPRRTGQDFRELCDTIGLNDFRFHDLRHDFCSQLVQAGQPLQVVQQLAGHTDISMTQRYSHLAPKQKVEAIAATFEVNIKFGNNLITVK